MNEKEIIEIINNKKQNEEFEVRFGKFNDNKFTPFLSLESYIKIIDFMDNIGILNDIEYSFIVKYRNGNRVTQILNNINNNITFPWESNIINDNIINKKTLKNKDDHEYNLRFSLSIENKLDNNNIKLLHNDNPIYYKSQKRHCYTFNNLNIHISMYKSANDINIISNMDLKYDIELEITKNSDINDIYCLINEFQRIIQNNFIILPNNKIIEIKNNYFNLVNNNKFIGIKPESLRLSKLSEDEEYAITIKLDGKRNLLFIVNNEIYLIDNRLNIIFFCTIKNNKYNGTIIDGELLDNTFYCFDILFYKNKDIRNDLILNKRMSLLIELLNDIGIGNIIIKEYLYGNLYSNFKNYISKYFNKKLINIDGIIIIPINKSYNDAIPLKWKPSNLNTIDFKIRKLNYSKEYEEWQLLCSNNIPFYSMDSIKTSSTESIIKVPIEIAKMYIDNSVIEFSYNKILETFEPLKLRADKNNGNYIKIAQDNFNLILIPFDIELLNKNKQIIRTGLFNLERYYHYIIRVLFNKYSKSINSLIDINGNDIQKWIDYNIRYVESYHSHKDSIINTQLMYQKIINKQYNKSFDNYSFKDISELHNVNTKFDMMTCFNSFNSFFKNNDKFEQFITFTKNLKIGGYLLISNIDFDLLDFNEYITEKDIKIKPVEINNSLKFGNSIIINKCNSGNIIEYLVSSSFFINYLKNIGFDLVESNTFNTHYNEWIKYDNILNYTEKKFTNLNRYYSFIKRKEYSILSKVVHKEVHVELHKEVVHKEVHVELPKEVHVELPKEIVLIDYTTKTLKELKILCKENNLKTYGIKNQLIERLNNLNIN